MNNGNYLYPILQHPDLAQYSLPQMPSGQTQAPQLPDANDFVMQALGQAAKSSGLFSEMLKNGQAGQMYANPADPQTGLNSFSSGGLFGGGGKPGLFSSVFGSGGIGGIFSALLGG